MNTVLLPPRTRNSALELLRIVSVWMIIGCHFATYGGFSFEPTELSASRFLYGLWETGGNLGTDIFVLISGYFLIENRSLSVKREKAFLLWGQVFFYSLLLFGVSFWLGTGEWSIKNVIRTLFPVTFSRWWFASVYFVLYLLHPYLNRFLHTLTRAEYRRFLTVTLLLFCLVPTLSASRFVGSELIEFFLLYSLAAYIKLHEAERKRTPARCFLFGVLFWAALYATYVALMLIGTKISALSALSLWFYGRNSVLTLGAALCFFCAASASKPFENRLVNTLSSAVFGVYLIHEHPSVRVFLWEKVFCGASYADSAFLPLLWLGTVFSVYIVCTGIELLRKTAIEKPLLRILKTISLKSKSQRNKTIREK